ncbi:MAG: hemin uptake protein HemP [Pirellulaceae bacterium]
MNQNPPQMPSESVRPDTLTGSHPAHADATRIPFETLAQGQPEVLIEFRGQLYRLRQTKNGKLILNK